MGLIWQLWVSPQWEPQCSHWGPTETARFKQWINKYQTKQRWRLLWTFWINADLWMKILICSIWNESLPLSAPLRRVWKYKRSGFCCSACCHIPPGCWQRAAQQFGQTHSSFFQVGSSCTNKHLSLWQLLFIHRIRFYAETASAHVHHSSPWTPDVLMLSQQKVSSYC